MPLRLILDPLLRRMLRPPQRAPRPLPPDLACRARDVTIAGPAQPMKAWRVEPVGPARGTAVFVHGWSSDGGRMAPLARHVVDAGIACLLVDLPGHGRTGPTEAYHAARMVEDLRAIADHVGPAALLGYSFGGVGAIVATARDPRWTALVVMATPVGPMEATEIYLRNKGLPARWLRGPLRRAARRIVGVDPDTFAGPRNLATLRVPALFVHGRHDAVVPFTHAERLHAAAPTGRAELVLVDGADHDGLLVDGSAGRQVATFLARVTF